MMQDENIGSHVVKKALYVKHFQSEPLIIWNSSLPVGLTPNGIR